MNNGYDNFGNYQNNNMTNNNFNNISNSTGTNNNQNNKNNILNVGLIIMLIIGAVFLVFTFLLDSEDNKKEEPPVTDNDVSKEDMEPDSSGEIPEEAPPVEEVIPDENPIVEDEIKDESTKDETTKVEPNSLKCTQTIKNEYGTFVYTNTYKFSNNQMTNGTIKVNATLKKSYRGYRDSLIQSLKAENKKFVKLDGISESVSKRSDGFTYTIKLNAQKLSKKELYDMGYRTLNYSGVKIQMYNNGYKCSK